MRILLFFSLLALTYTYCNSKCNTCVGQDIMGVMTYSCTSCASGYYLEGSTCHSCDQSHYEPCKAYFDKLKRDRSMIALSISASTVVLVLVILCCCLCKKYKCCTNEEPPQATQNELNERTRTYLAPINLQVSEIELKKIVGQQKQKGNDKEVNTEQNCVICLQSKVFLQTNCKHRFHPNCIWQWIARNHYDCPLCKNEQILPVKIFCHKCNNIYFELNFIPNQDNLQINKWQFCKNCTKQQTP